MQNTTETREIEKRRREIERSREFKSQNGNEMRINTKCVLMIDLMVFNKYIIICSHRLVVYIFFSSVWFYGENFRLFFFSMEKKIQ